MYTGSLKNFEGSEIYLNITYLEKGVYQLKIVDKNAL